MLFHNNVEMSRVKNLASDTIFRPWVYVTVVDENRSQANHIRTTKVKTRLTDPQEQFQK
jgi:hypothetical protein